MARTSGVLGGIALVVVLVVGSCVYGGYRVAKHALSGAQTAAGAPGGEQQTPPA